MVQPSGFARATASVPITVVAPDRFSTTTALPSSEPTFSPSARATRSPTPPAGLGTIILINRAGQASAAVAMLVPPKLAAVSTVKAQTSLLNVVMSLPSSRLSAKAVVKRPDARDRYRDFIPRLEKAGRIEADPDAGRRAGGDEIAGPQGEARRDRSDQRGDIEDEIAGIGVLPELAVYPAFHLEIVWIELVGRRDPGTHRAEGVERLPHEPLLVIALPIARGHIVDDGVAPDVFVGMLECDVAPRLPDDQRELGLVIDSGGDVGMELDRVAVADDGGRWLGEYGGVLVDLGSLHSPGLVAAPRELLRMLAIIL